MGDFPFSDMSLNFFNIIYYTNGITIYVNKCSSKNKNKEKCFLMSLNNRVAHFLISRHRLNGWFIKQYLSFSSKTPYHQG